MDWSHLNQLFDEWETQSRFLSDPTEITALGKTLSDLGENVGEFLIHKLKNGHLTASLLLADVYPNADIMIPQDVLGSLRDIRRYWLSWWERKTGKTISSVRVIHTKDPIPRVESGALQINEDWPGLFIRGDQALNLAMSIKTLLRFLQNTEISGFQNQLAILELRSIQQTIFEDVRQHSPGDL